MAFTPTDPTKAEVRVTGTAPNQQLDFYIPRGAKGEPGGIVLGTILGTTDLNSITTPGTYRQSDASGASGSLANNYPFTGSYGTLNVFGTTASDVVQEFHLQSYNNAVDARRVYRRAKSNGVWSPWRCYNSTRVDQTAGRVIYQWDDLNSREQIIYGDTGWRSIVGMSVAGVGTLHIRRVGQMVTINAVGVNSTAGASYVTIFASGQLPGFVPSITMRSVATTAAGAARILDIAGGLEMRLFAPEAAPYSFSIAYPTNDAWPTTLPGTASGTIPNL